MTIPKDHKQCFAPYVEGVSVNITHGSMVEEEEEEEEEERREDRGDTLLWEPLGFITWDELNQLRKWAKTKPTQQKFFRVEGLVFEWDANGPIVYVASQSKYFAPNEVLDQWPCDFLDWIAARRNDDGAREKRPYGRILDRQLFHTVSEIIENPDGHALLRQILGFDAIDHLKRECKSLNPDAILAKLRSEVFEKLEPIMADIKAGPARDKVRESFAFLSRVTGNTDEAFRILSDHGATGVSQLLADDCPAIEREAEYVAVVALLKKLRKTKKSTAATDALNNEKLSGMSAKQLRSVAMKLAKVP